MNINKLPVVIGISLLSGVASSLIFMETRYFYMSKTPREITKEEYSSEKGKGVYGGARFLMEKKVNNYEIGALTAVSVFAGLLIFNGLRNGKKTNSDN